MADGATNLTVVQDSTSFLKSPVDLKKLYKQVSKETTKAIEVLVKLLESKDEKTQLTAAKALVDLHATLAKDINQEQMQRLIAEIRLNRPQPGGVLLTQGGTGQTEKPKPLVDFTTVREVD